MNRFQRNIYRTEDASVEPEPTLLELATISSASLETPDIGCTLTPDATCWVDTASPGIITSGDTVYVDEMGTTVFEGNNFYYKITLVSNYVVQVDNLGVMSVAVICT